MNNSQFRKLVLDTPARQPSASRSSGTLGATPRRDGATSAALGSRMRSSISMTPRSVAAAGGVDFARQLAEKNAVNQPTKKFRTAAPKGAKLASGYIDRTKERGSGDDSDKAARVKALEEMVKLRQIDQATFEILRDEIVGGDVENVHLVKGLDYKLLERVRRGEDILNQSTKVADGTEGWAEDVDADKELELLENKEIEATMREKIVKKGEMAPPSLLPGKKRNRDQILAELKASRAAAKQAGVSSLGAKFKKVGAPRLASKIEVDSKGREILIVVDELGNEKRKIRKTRPVQPLEKDRGLLMPDKDAVPLGMEVPEIPKEFDKEEDDINIFDDAGDDYDPLADLEDEDDDSGAEKSDTKETTEKGAHQTTEPSKGVKQEPEISLMPPPPRPRNYFNETTQVSGNIDIGNSKGLADATVIAALKKASSLSLPTDLSSTEAQETLAREARRKKLLQQATDDRDAADMDLGFGSSRFEDGEDFEESRVKLSQWSGGGDDDEGTGKGQGKGGRKRGPKRRKGDKDSVADVLGVLERRKLGGSANR